MSKGLAQAYSRRLERYMDDYDYRWIDSVVQERDHLQVFLRPGAPEYLTGKIVFNNGRFKEHDVLVKRLEP